MSAEEPIGVMKCWECVEKHARDLEHHYEDIIRVEKDPQKRLKYEEAIDYIRNLRKEAHEKAKGIAIEDPATDQDLEAQLERYKKIGYWEGYFETLKKLKAKEQESEEEIHFSEPIRREHGKEVYVDVYHEKEECHPSSFRVIKPNPEHILTVCCPAGQYDEAGGKCLVGTMAQKLEHLHPEGEGSCPICGGA